MPEEAMWIRLWKMPQALVWEADRSHDLVALYVRTMIEAMQPGARDPARNQARYLSAELLLTPSALLSARYVIAGSEEDSALQASITRHPAGSKGHAGRPRSARDRFQVVPDAGPEESQEEDQSDAPAEPE